MRMRLRDGTGQWYDPDPRDWSTLTRLRDSAAKVEADTGLVITVARGRMPLRIGALTIRARAWEITVKDGAEQPCEAGWTCVRTARNAAHIIRGIGLGARVITHFMERKRSDWQ